MDPFIMQEGRKIIGNPNFTKDPIIFTQELLKLKKEMDEIIAMAF